MIFCQFFKLTCHHKNSNAEEIKSFEAESSRLIILFPVISEVRCHLSPVQFSILMMDNVVAIIEDAVIQGAFTNAIVSEMSVFGELLRVNKNMLREVAKHKGKSRNTVRYYVKPCCRIGISLIEVVLEDQVSGKFTNQNKSVPGGSPHECTVRQFKSYSESMTKPVLNEMEKVVALVG